MSKRIEINKVRIIARKFFHFTKLITLFGIYITFLIFSFKICEYFSEFSILPSTSFQNISVDTCSIPFFFPFS